MVLTINTLQVGAMCSPNVPDGRADYHLLINYNVIVPTP